MYFFIFFLGIFVGSFLNVFADRLPRDEGFINGRSHCEKCKKELAWYDMIPLLSFVLLKGKCRYCHTQLSWYYPITELTTGMLFAGTFFFIGDGNINSIIIINIIYYLFLVSCLIVVFFADLKYGIIPDKVVFPAILVSFFFLLFTSEVGIVNHILSAVGASLFFLMLFLITKGRGMGFGDVKFAFLMGLVLGFPKIVVSLYIAFLTGAVVGIMLILWRRKKIFGTAIPFGPFLVLGTIIAIFWGERIFELVVPLVLP